MVTKRNIKPRVYLSEKQKREVFEKYMFDGVVAHVLAKEYNISEHHVYYTAWVIGGDERKQYQARSRRREVPAGCSFEPHDNYSLTEEQMLNPVQPSDGMYSYILYANRYLHVPRQYRDHPIDLFEKPEC